MAETTSSPGFVVLLGSFEGSRELRGSGLLGCCEAVLAGVPVPVIVAEEEDAGMDDNDSF